jgi:hypothetical protein
MVFTKNYRIINKLFTCPVLRRRFPAKVSDTYRPFCPFYYMGLCKAYPEKPLAVVSLRWYYNFPYGILLQISGELFFPPILPGNNPGSRICF